MDNLPNTLTVYEKKRIFLTEDELRSNGYDGLLTDLRTACERAIDQKIKVYSSNLRAACERAIGQKIKVYSSNINAISMRKLEKLGAYEVDYYHIHSFDKVYIEEIIYKAYRDSGLRIDNVFVSAYRNINIDIKLSTSITNVKSIVKFVNLENLKKKLDEYITLNYEVSVDVTVKLKGDFSGVEILRFYC